MDLETQLLSKDNLIGMDTTDTHTDAPTESLDVKQQFFIAVHLGAGYHKKKDEMFDAYKDLIIKACTKGKEILSNNGTADDAVAAAISVLEDSGKVNAGLGSHLNVVGEVDCDAGFMKGNGLFGGVGALPGIKNPIQAAKKLVETQEDKSYPAGLVPPTVLVGDAARVWAVNEGVYSVDKEKFVTADKTKKLEKMLLKYGQMTPEENGVSDTVGAIALDFYGHVASGVSTGGSWLKIPGRIGHAPLFGSGCYAANFVPPDKIGAAVSTSGLGERLGRFRLAASTAGCLTNPKVTATVETLKSHVMRLFADFKGFPTAILGLFWNGQRGELVSAHNSPSFVYGYLGSEENEKIKMSFSLLPNDGKLTSVKIQCCSL